MAAIIQRTNPDFDRARGKWRCAACKTIFDDEDEARECAVDDHETGRHKRSADAAHYTVPRRVK